MSACMSSNLVCVVICVLVHAPKLVSALVCAPKLLWALLCALVCAPVGAILCAPKHYLTITNDIHTLIQSHIIGTLSNHHK